MRRIFAFLAIALWAALPAAAAPSHTIAIAPSLLGLGSGSTLTVSLLGTEVSLGFEDVSNLNLLSLGLSVQLINPLDPGLRARLPEGTVFSALPVLVRIEPPAWGGLSFRGLASLDIHTTLLPYAPTSPLRIFSAPLGGQFRDVTADMGPGSYRVRGTMGGFSEFLIAVDLRTIDQVIAAKVGALESMLDTYEGTMPGSVYDDLEEILDDIQADIASNHLADAIAGVDDFLEEVEDHSGGTGIPNVWRAARDRTNAAGYLRAGAETLRFSLVLKTL
jgi:hypothetical protein